MVLVSSSLCAVTSTWLNDHGRILGGGGGGGGGSHPHTQHSYIQMYGSIWISFRLGGSRSMKMAIPFGVGGVSQRKSKPSNPLPEFLDPPLN